MLTKEPANRMSEKVCNCIKKHFHNQAGKHLPLLTMWRGEVRALEATIFFIIFCACLFLPLWKGEAFICLLSRRIYPSFFLFMAFNSELEWILWVLMRTSSALTGHLRPHESKHIGQLLSVIFPHPLPSLGVMTAEREGVVMQGKITNFWGWGRGNCSLQVILPRV